MEHSFKSFINDLISTVETDENDLKYKMLQEYKSNIMKSFSDVSYYNYSDFGELSVKTCKQFLDLFLDIKAEHMRKNNIFASTIENYGKIVNDFLDFSRDEKIVYWKLISISRYVSQNFDSRGCGTYAYYIKQIEKSKLTYSIVSIDSTQQMIGRCICQQSNINHQNRTWCENDDSSKSQGGVSLQFVFLTNYGKIISNFDKPTNEIINLPYVTTSNLYLKKYYFWLPIDYIKIIQSCNPVDIYDIIDRITKELYRRTTFDIKPSKIKIENAYLENNAINLKKIVRQIENETNELTLEYNNLFAEYNTLLYIEKKYNKMLEDLQSDVAPATV